MENFLVDIDGTVCEDIKNEEDWKFPDAKVIDGAVEKINKLFDEGNTITFFTSRRWLHRAVTIEWLNKNGFKYNALITDKPRGKYTIIDNLDVKAIKFNGDWRAI